MNNLKEVFEELRGIMLPATGSLDVTLDEPGNFDVYTFHVEHDDQCYSHNNRRIAQQ